jgi:hypothetical protein
MGRTGHEVSDPPSERLEGVDLLAALLDGSLPRLRWTHEAHLEVCLLLVRATDDDLAVTSFLRRAITSYNARSATTGRYHETITRYYVGAVRHVVRCAADRGTGDLADLTAAGACSRQAPGRHWSADVLASELAHERWVEPDLRPLPWRAPTDR